MNDYIRNNTKSVVTIFSKDNCPFCVKAKEVLDAGGIEYKEVDVTETAEGLEQFKQVHDTVPQIYIGVNCIGGSEVAALIVDRVTKNVMTEERAPKVHEVRSISSRFPNIINGSQSFDIRKNDRDYRKDDHIVMREYDEKLGMDTGRVVVARINFLMENDVALSNGFVILNLRLTDTLINEDRSKQWRTSGGYSKAYEEAKSV